MPPGGLSRRHALYGAVLSLLVLHTAGTFAQTPNNDLQEGLRAYAQRNYAVALRHWGTAAQRGDAAAQYNVGRLYARGEGVPRDYAEAYKWFTLAAAGGRRVVGAASSARHVAATGGEPAVPQFNPAPGVVTAVAGAASERDPEW